MSSFSSVGNVPVSAAVMPKHKPMARSTTETALPSPLPLTPLQQDAFEKASTSPLFNQAGVAQNSNELLDIPYALLRQTGEGNKQRILAAKPADAIFQTGKSNSQEVIVDHPTSQVALDGEGNSQRLSALDAKHVELSGTENSQEVQFDGDVRLLEENGRFNQSKISVRKNIEAATLNSPWGQQTRLSSTSLQQIHSTSHNAQQKIRLGDNEKATEAHLEGSGNQVEFVYKNNPKGSQNLKIEGISNIVSIHTHERPDEVGVPAEQGSNDVAWLGGGHNLTQLNLGQGKDKIAIAFSPDSTSVVEGRERNK